MLLYIKQNDGNICSGLDSAPGCYVEVRLCTAACRACRSLCIHWLKAVYCSRMKLGPMG